MWVAIPLALQREKVSHALRSSKRTSLKEPTNKKTGSHKMNKSVDPQEDAEVERLYALQQDILRQLQQLSKTETLQAWPNARSSVRHAFIFRSSHERRSIIFFVKQHFETPKTHPRGCLAFVQTLSINLLYPLGAEPTKILPANAKRSAWILRNSVEMLPYFSSVWYKNGFPFFCGDRMSATAYAWDFEFFGFPPVSRPPFGLSPFRFVFWKKESSPPSSSDFLHFNRPHRKRELGLYCWIERKRLARRMHVSTTFR